MKAIILGSAAGGGFPQWNCRCGVCALYWQGDARVQRRTQSSLAVTSDSSQWVLLNCSPDIREQIGATRHLQPRELRHSPIVSVVITNSDIDHIGGLLSLREGHRFSIHAARNVLAQIKSNPVFNVLNPDFVVVHEIKPNVSFSPAPGLTMKMFEVPGKVPLYRESETSHAVGRSGNTFGLHVWERDTTMSYVPGCGNIDDQLLSDLAATHTLFFDGTVWTDDEMCQAGVGQKTGRRMGHVPVSGDDGSIETLKQLTCTQRIFVHLNNTNPLLIDGSPERLFAEAANWQVGCDGMEITL